MHGKLLCFSSIPDRVKEQHMQINHQDRRNHCRRSEENNKLQICSEFQQNRIAYIVMMLKMTILVRILGLKQRYFLEYEETVALEVKVKLTL